MLRGKILTLEEFPSKHEPYWGSVKPEECKFDKDIYTLAVKCAKDFISCNSATYKEKYKVFRNEDGAWNNVEAEYEECLLEVMNNRSQQHPTEEVERILGDYGLNDYGEVNFYGYSFESYDEELAIIFNFISLLDEFEKDLQSYLRTNCNDQKLKLLTDRKAVSKILDKSDCIITFNYTHTAELLYGATQTIHIHSDIDNTIAIGSGALEDAKNSTIDYEYPTRDSFPKNKDGLIEMMMYYTDDMNGHLVEDSFIRRFFDRVAVEASKKKLNYLIYWTAKAKMH